MAFGVSNRREIRERSGYYCQICGDWHPPRRGEETALDAHSVDRSHQDGGMTVCRARVAGDCHVKLHQVTNEATELERVSRTAANLNTLSAAIQMEAQGIPDKKIRGVLARLGNF